MSDKDFRCYLIFKVVRNIVGMVLLMLILIAILKWIWPEQFH